MSASIAASSDNGAPMPSLAALDPRLEIAILRTQTGELLPLKVGETALGRYKVAKVFANRIEIEIVAPASSPPARVWLWKSEPGDSSPRVTSISNTPEANERPARITVQVNSVGAQ